MKLGPRRNYHKGQAAKRHYANQPACLKCESASKCFQAGEGPSRGLLRDCENRLWNRWTTTQPVATAHPPAGTRLLVAAKCGGGFLLHLGRNKNQPNLMSHVTEFKSILLEFQIKLH